MACTLEKDEYSQPKNTHKYPLSINKTNVLVPKPIVIKNRFNGLDITDNSDSLYFCEAQDDAVAQEIDMSNRWKRQAKSNESKKTSSNVGLCKMKSKLKEARVKFDELDSIIEEIEPTSEAESEQQSSVPSADDNDGGFLTPGTAAGAQRQSKGTIAKTTGSKTGSAMSVSGEHSDIAVSYTHLTLPTILRV